MADVRWECPFEVPELTYEGALTALDDTMKFGIQPLLECVDDMLLELGDPDLAFASVQVAGTNGKTSTTRYTAAILAGEGYRIALYTSPELVRMNERMEVAGRPISDEQFARGIAAAVEAGRRINERRAAAGERPYDITQFDLLTVAACVVFAEAAVDVCVLECGMGGRWDATSAVRSIRNVAITGIGLDHMRILGDTLEAIAGEKAAIIRTGRTCVLGVGTATPDSVEDVFLERCAEQGVEPVLLRPEVLSDAAGEMHPGEPRAHEDLPHASYRIVARPGAAGSAMVVDVATPRASYQGIRAIKPGYQAANIACAIALSEDFLDRSLDPAALAASVAACPTPGRFDVLCEEPLVMVDACHNPQSVETFLTAVRAMEPDVAKRPQLLCAVLADKDVAGIVELLAAEFPRVVVTRTESPRACEAEELAELFRNAGKEPAAVYGSVEEAVAALEGQSYVACGSITTAGEVAGIWRG